MTNDWKPFIRQKLSKWVFFAGLVFIIFHLFRTKPVNLEVVYEYGEGRHGLQAVQVIFLKDGEEIRRAFFNYEKQGPPLTENHQVSLPRGEYELDFELFYPGKAPSALAAKNQHQQQGRTVVHIKRLLPVKNGGKAVVTVM